MMTPAVTFHAVQRLRTRLKVPGTYAATYAKRAWTHGIHRNQAPAGLKRFLSKVPKDSLVRVHEDNVYIFKFNSKMKPFLVTVYPIPDFVDKEN